MHPPFFFVDHKVDAPKPPSVVQKPSPRPGVITRILSHLPRPGGKARFAR